MKKTQASGPVKKVKQALGQRPSLHGTQADISEGFRRARSSISDITADLQQLRRHGQSTGNRPQRPAKSK